MARLKGGREPGICNKSDELLKAGGPTMIRGLHVALTVEQKSGPVT